MTKQRWEGSMKSLRSHMDPEIEEQLKWIKIGKIYTPEQPQSLKFHNQSQRLWDYSIGSQKTMQFKVQRLPVPCYPERGFLWYTEWQRVRKIENNVRRCLKIIKSLHPSRDGHLKRKSELIQLVEDINKEYHSLYALYDNLRGEVRKKVHGKDPDGSCSSMSSTDETYYTPEELNDRNHEPDSQHQETQSKNLNSETPDSEDGSLKDKLTSTSELDETLTMDSASSFGEVPESVEIIKDLRIQLEQSETRRQKLLDECVGLKEKLVRREEEILSITKKHQAFGEQKLADIKELESKVQSLNLEIENMTFHKRAIEEQVECKSNEAKQLKEEQLGLQTRILELESMSKQKEDQFSSLLKKSEEDDQQSLSAFEGMTPQANNVQQEVDSLRSEKCELEVKLTRETEEKSAKINELIEQTKFLQQELESMSRQKTELELQLKKKCGEISECQSQVEELKEKLPSQASCQGTTEEKEGLKLQVKDLELEVNSLSRKKSDLEDQLIISNSEANHLKIEKEVLDKKILELETTLKERDNELSILEKMFNDQEDKMCAQITSLKSEVNNFRQELENLQAEKIGLELQLEREKEASAQTASHLETKNIGLANKIADQEKDLIEMEDTISKLKKDQKQVGSQLAHSKSCYQIAEKRIEEMAEEFCKKFEDNLRILSRRIRVAEQMHLENKELYEKTKHVYEEENKDLKERVAKNETGLKQIKEISLVANELLSTQDAVALKFEECTANFLNRISKVSCALKFAKDWVRRKNKAIGHVKDDLECLLAQLDDKEAEILVFREKVWKSENKIRELEKLIIESQEGMLSLKEEKREAIRQLCVWIDYHRSRSDYYKKMISEITSGCRKTP